MLIEDTKGGIDWNPNLLLKMTYFRNTSLKGVHTNRSETSTDLLFPYIYSLLISFLLRMVTNNTELAVAGRILSLLKTVGALFLLLQIIIYLAFD